METFSYLLMNIRIEDVIHTAAGSLEEEGKTYDKMNLFVASLSCRLDRRICMSDGFFDVETVQVDFVRC
jgi:hypothetical protein